MISNECPAKVSMDYGPNIKTNDTHLTKLFID